MATTTLKTPRRKKAEKEKKDIREHVIQVLQETEQGNRKYQLRLERWTVEGKQGAVKFAKREMYVNKKTGEIRSGGAKGLSFAECRYLIDNWSELEPFFK